MPTTTPGDAPHDATAPSRHPDGPAPSRRAADRTGGNAAGSASAPARHDRALQQLLLAAERDVRVGMTVTAGGAVVSGRLVGTRAYYRALADHFTTVTGRTAMDESFAESFGALVEEAADVAHGDRRAVPDQAAYEQAVAYVHLTEARYVAGSGLLPLGRHGVLYRCRVADVQGWALGELMPA